MNEEFITGETAHGESKAVKFNKDSDVLILGSDMIRIDLRNPEELPPVVGPFTKVTGTFE